MDNAIKIVLTDSALADYNILHSTFNDKCNVIPYKKQINMADILNKTNNNTTHLAIMEHTTNALTLNINHNDIDYDDVNKFNFINNSIYEAIKQINNITDNKLIVDILMCNINNEQINELTLIEKQLDITIRYSNDLLGNVPPATWILNSHNVNVQDLYFNENINLWKHNLNNFTATLVSVSNPPPPIPGIPSFPVFEITLSGNPSSDSFDTSSLFDVTINNSLINLDSNSIQFMGNKIFISLVNESELDTNDSIAVKFTNADNTLEGIKNENNVLLSNFESNFTFSSSPTTHDPNSNTDTTSPTAAITYNTAGPYKSGDTVTITATFNEDMKDDPVPHINITGSNVVLDGHMTKTSATVYTYVHTVDVGNGDATIELIGEDLAGNAITSANTSGATFIVDNTNPTITLTGDSTINITKDTVYNELGATATDNNDGDITADITIAGNVNTSNVGTYEIKYNVLDAVGNTATEVTRTVNVNEPADTTSPTAAITYNTAGPYKSGDTVTITATFNEDMKDDPVPHINITGSNVVLDGHMTKTSTTVYTYVHTVGAGNGDATIALSMGEDLAGNVITSAPTSGATFIVDNTNPTITLTGDSTINITKDTAYTELGATATDNNDGDITANININGSVNINVVDTYTLTYSITDSAGNIASVNRTVNVNEPGDTARPTAAITYSTPGPYNSGDSVTITATFSEDMKATPKPKIAISGVSTITATDMTDNNDGTWSYLYTTPVDKGTETISLSIAEDLAGNVISPTPTSGSSFIINPISLTYYGPITTVNKRINIAQGKTWSPIYQAFEMDFDNASHPDNFGPYNNIAEKINEHYTGINTSSPNRNFIKAYVSGGALDGQEVTSSLETLPIGNYTITFEEISDTNGTRINSNVINLYVKILDVLPFIFKSKTNANSISTKTATDASNYGNGDCVYGFDHAGGYSIRPNQKTLDYIIPLQSVSYPKSYEERDNGEIGNTIIIDRIKLGYMDYEYTESYNDDGDNCYKYIVNLISYYDNGYEEIDYLYDENKIATHMLRNRNEADWRSQALCVAPNNTSNIGFHYHFRYDDFVYNDSNQTKDTRPYLDILQWGFMPLSRNVSFQAYGLSKWEDERYNFIQVNTSSNQYGFKSETREDGETGTHELTKYQVSKHNLGFGPGIFQRFNGKISATDNPIILEYTWLNKLFRDSDISNNDFGNIGNWDTKNVHTMIACFEGCKYFNKDIGNWNTTNTINLSRMFFNAPTFNQDISTKTVNQGLANEYTAWNVSNNIDTSYMFCNWINDSEGMVDSNGREVYTSFLRNVYENSQKHNFNKDISNWDMQNVVNASHMFYNARDFNIPIGSWQTLKLENAIHMFSFATSFNQDITTWDTSKLKIMNFMFAHAVSFNYNILSNWDLSSIGKKKGLQSGWWHNDLLHNYVAGNTDQGGHGSNADMNALRYTMPNNTKYWYEIFEENNIAQGLSKPRLMRVTKAAWDVSYWDKSALATRTAPLNNQISWYDILDRNTGANPSAIMVEGIGTARDYPMTLDNFRDFMTPIHKGSLRDTYEMCPTSGFRNVFYGAKNFTDCLIMEVDMASANEIATLSNENLPNESKHTYWKFNGIKGGPENKYDTNSRLIYSFPNTSDFLRAQNSNKYNSTVDAGLNPGKHISAYSLNCPLINVGDMLSEDELIMDSNDRSNADRNPKNRPNNFLMYKDVEIVALEVTPNKIKYGLYYSDLNVNSKYGFTTFFPKFKITHGPKFTNNDYEWGNSTSRFYDSWKYFLEREIDIKKWNGVHLNSTHPSENSILYDWGGESNNGDADGGIEILETKDYNIFSSIRSFDTDVNDVPYIKENFLIYDAPSWCLKTSNWQDPDIRYISTQRGICQNGAISVYDYMFTKCPIPNNIENWDFQNVKSMKGWFLNKNDFNGADLSKMNTSNVIYMQYMFAFSNFNDDISTKTINTGLSNEYTAWNVSNVRDMKFMFANNSSFNQNISNWDVSSLDPNNYNFNNEFSTTTKERDAYSMLSNNVFTINPSSEWERVLGESIGGDYKYGSNPIAWAPCSLDAISYNIRYGDDAPFYNNIWFKNSTAFENYTTFRSHYQVDMASANNYIVNSNVSHMYSNRRQGAFGMFFNATAFNNGGSPDIKNWQTNKGFDIGHMFNGAVNFEQDISYWWSNPNNDWDAVNGWNKRVYKYHDTKNYINYCNDTDYMFYGADKYIEKNCTNCFTFDLSTNKLKTNINDNFKIYLSTEQNWKNTTLIWIEEFDHRDDSYYPGEGMFITENIYDSWPYTNGFYNSRRLMNIEPSAYENFGIITPPHMNLPFDSLYKSIEDKDNQLGRKGRSLYITFNASPVAGKTRIKVLFNQFDNTPLLESNEEIEGGITFNHITRNICKPNKTRYKQFSPINIKLFYNITLTQDDDWADVNKIPVAHYMDIINTSGLKLSDGLNRSTMYINKSINSYKMIFGVDNFITETIRVESKRNYIHPYYGSTGNVLTVCLSDWLEYSNFDSSNHGVSYLSNNGWNLGEIQVNNGRDIESRGNPGYTYHEIMGELSYIFENTPSSDIRLYGGQFYKFRGTLPNNHNLISECKVKYACNMFAFSNFTNNDYNSLVNWDVSNVKLFSNMFYGTPFNQSIDNWIIKNNYSNFGYEVIRNTNINFPHHFDLRHIVWSDMFAGANDFDKDLRNLRMINFDKDPTNVSTMTNSYKEKLYFRYNIYRNIITLNDPDPSDLGSLIGTGNNMSTKQLELYNNDPYYYLLPKFDLDSTIYTNKTQNLRSFIKNYNNEIYFYNNLNDIPIGNTNINNVGSNSNGKEIEAQGLWFNITDDTNANITLRNKSKLPNDSLAEFFSNYNSQGMDSYNYKSFLREDVNGTIVLSNMKGAGAGQENLSDGTYLMRVTLLFPNYDHDFDGNNPVVEKVATLVVNTVKPVLTLVGSSEIVIKKGSAYNEQGCTASDNNMVGDITNDIVISNNADVNTIGIYTATYNVTDIAGNIAIEKQRLINVIDVDSDDSIVDFILDKFDLGGNEGNRKIIKNPTERETSRNILRNLSALESRNRRKNIHKDLISLNINRTIDSENLFSSAELLKRGLRTDRKVRLIESKTDKVNSIQNKIKIRDTNKEDEVLYSSLELNEFISIELDGNDGDITFEHYGTDEYRYYVDNSDTPVYKSGNIGFTTDDVLSFPLINPKYKFTFGSITGQNVVNAVLTTNPDSSSGVSGNPYIFNGITLPFTFTFNANIDNASFIVDDIEIINIDDSITLNNNNTPGLITDFLITNNNVCTFNLNFETSIEEKEISIKLPVDVILDTVGNGNLESNTIYVKNQPAMLLFDIDAFSNTTKVNDINNVVINVINITDQLIDSVEVTSNPVISNDKVIYTAGNQTGTIKFQNLDSAEYTITSIKAIGEFNSTVNKTSLNGGNNIIFVLDKPPGPIVNSVERVLNENGTGSWDDTTRFNTLYTPNPYIKLDITTISGINSNKTKILKNDGGIVVDTIFDTHLLYTDNGKTIKINNSFFNIAENANTTTIYTIAGIRLEDNAGNTIDHLFNATLIVDTIAPDFTAAIGRSDGIAFTDGDKLSMNATPDNKPIITLTRIDDNLAGDEIVNVSVILDDDSILPSANVSLSNNVINLVGLANGIYKIKDITANDSAGNPKTITLTGLPINNNNYFTIDINNDKPVLTLNTTAPNRNINENTIDITLGANNPIKVKNKANINNNLINGSSLAINDTSYLTEHSGVLTLKQDGTTTLLIETTDITDEYGNEASAQISISRTEDSTAPIAATLSSILSGNNSDYFKNGETISFTIDLQESVYKNNAAADLLLSDISIVANGITLNNNDTNVTTLTKNSDIKYTLTLTNLTGDGSLTVSILSGTYEDEAGNDVAASNAITKYIDNTKPGIAITSGTVNSGDITNDSTIALTFTSTEDTVNFISDDISVSNGAISGFAGSNSSYTATFTPTVDGVCNISVSADKFTDIAGNNNTESGNFILTYDSISPTVALTFSDNTNVHKYTNSQTHNIKLAITEVNPTYPYDLVAAWNNNGGNKDVSMFKLENVIIKDISQDGNANNNNYVIEIEAINESINNGATLSDNRIEINFKAGVFNDSATNSNNVSNVLSYTWDETLIDCVLTKSGDGWTEHTHADANVGDTLMTSTQVRTIKLNLDVNAPSRTPANEGSTDVGSYTYDNSYFTLVNCNITTLTASGKDITLTATAITQGVVSVIFNAGNINDTAGNSNTVSNKLEWVYDTIKPVITLTSNTANLSGSYNATAAQDFTLTVVERAGEAIDYDLTDLVLNDNDFTIVNGSISNLTNLTSHTNKTATFKITASGQGIVSVYFNSGSVSDIMGNTNVDSNIIQWTYDNINPTYTKFELNDVSNKFHTVDNTNAGGNGNNNDHHTKNSVHTINLDLFDTNNLKQDYTLTDANFNLTNASITNFTLVKDGTQSNDLTITANGLGPVSVQLKENQIQDVANNYLAASSILTWNYDNVAPVLSLDYVAGMLNTTHTNSVKIRIKMLIEKDNGTHQSDLEAYTLAVGDFTTTNVSTIDNFSTLPTNTSSAVNNTVEVQFDVTAAAEGNVSIQLNKDILDLAGNVGNKPSISWIYDNTSPSVNLVVASGDDASDINTNSPNTYFHTPNGTQTLTMTITEAHSVLKVHQFIEDNFDKTNCNVSVVGNDSTDNNTKVFTLTVVAIAQGNVSVKLKSSIFQDNSNKDNLESNVIVWKYDDTEPVVSFNTDVVNLNGDWTNQQTHSVTLSVNDVNELEQNYTINDNSPLFSRTNCNISTAVLNKTTKTISFNVTAINENDMIEIKLLKHTINDKAGNKNQNDISRTWYWDNTLPTSTIEFVSNNTLENNHTNDQTHRVKLTINDTQDLSNYTITDGLLSTGRVWNYGQSIALQNGWAPMTNNENQPDTINGVDTGNAVVTDYNNSWWFKRGYDTPGTGCAASPAMANPVGGDGNPYNKFEYELKFRCHTAGDNSRLSLNPGSPTNDDRASSYVEAYNSSGPEGLHVRAYLHAGPGAGWGGEYIVLKQNLDTNSFHTLKAIMIHTGGYNDEWVFYINNELITNASGYDLTNTDIKVRLSFFQQARADFGYGYTKSGRIKFQPRHPNYDASYMGYYIKDISVITSSTTDNSLQEIYSEDFTSADPNRIFSTIHNIQSIELVNNDGTQIIDTSGDGHTSNDKVMYFNITAKDPGNVQLGLGDNKFYDIANKNNNNLGNGNVASNILSWNYDNESIVCAITPDDNDMINLDGHYTRDNEVILKLTIINRTNLVAHTFNESDFTITNCTLSTFSVLSTATSLNNDVSITFKASVSSIYEGPISVKLNADVLEDIANKNNSNAIGNKNTASNLIAWTRDYTSPTVLITPSVNNLEGSRTNVSEHEFDIVITEGSNNSAGTLRTYTLSQASFTLTDNATLVFLNNAQDNDYATVSEITNGTTKKKFRCKVVAPAGAQVNKEMTMQLKADVIQDTAIGNDDNGNKNVVSNLITWYYDNQKLVFSPLYNNPDLLKDINDNYIKNGSTVVAGSVLTIDIDNDKNVVGNSIDTIVINWANNSAIPSQQSYDKLTNKLTFTTLATDEIYIIDKLTATDEAGNIEYYEYDNFTIYGDTDETSGLASLAGIDRAKMEKIRNTIPNYIDNNTMLNISVDDKPVFEATPDTTEKIKSNANKRYGFMKLLFAKSNKVNTNKVVSKYKLKNEDLGFSAKQLSTFNKPFLTVINPKPIDNNDNASQLSLETETNLNTGWYNPLDNNEQFVFTLTTGQIYKIKRQLNKYTLEKISPNNVILETDIVANSDNTGDLANGYVDDDTIILHADPIIFGGAGGNGNVGGTLLGDPYIQPVFGNKYKMPVDNKIYRLYDNNNNKDRFLVNAQMSVMPYDYAKKLNENWLAKTKWADKNTVLFDNNMSFMTKVYIKYKDKEIFIDLESQRIIRSNFYARLLPAEYINNTIQSYKNEYKRVKKLRFITDTMGVITILLEKYANPQIRTGINIIHDSNPTNYVGAMVRHTKSKYIRVKKLNNTKKLSKNALKAKQYNVAVVEQFTNIYNNKVNNNSNEILRI